MSVIFTKDPSDSLPFGIDWSEELGPGVTITTSGWEVELGLFGSDEQFDGQLTTIWLSAGEEGETYRVYNMVQVSDGRRYRRYFDVRVEHK